MLARSQPLVHRSQAITAMVLAERLAAGDGNDDVFVIGWVPRGAGPVTDRLIRMTTGGCGGDRGRRRRGHLIPARISAGAVARRVWRDRPVAAIHRGRTHLGRVHGPTPANMSMATRSGTSLPRSRQTAASTEAFKATSSRVLPRIDRPCCAAGSDNGKRVN